MAAVFVTGSFVTIMDGTIINVALPTIGHAFQVTPTAVGAIAIAYLIAMGSVVPVSGWMAHRFGTKRVLLVALLGFTMASAFCGISGSLPELVMFRIVQGLAGGILAPVGLAMLYHTFPPQDRFRVSTFTMFPTLLAPASGPVLGGVLVNELSWRFVFFVNVPIGLAGALFGLRWVTEIELTERAGRLDLIGFLLATLALGMLMFGLSEGPVLGWSSSAVLVTALGGAMLLAVTVLVELRAQAPLLALRLFANRAFRAGNGILASTEASFMGTLFAISLYLQYGRGLNPLTSGLSTFPEAVGVLCGGQIANRILYRKLRPRRLIIVGVLGAALTTALLATMGAHTSLWWTRLIMFCVGLSVGQIFIPTQVTAFSDIDPAATGSASTMFSVVRQVSSALGIALLTTVVGLAGAAHRSSGHSLADLDAYRWPFLVAAVLALCGLPSARCVRPKVPH